VPHHRCAVLFLTAAQRRSGAHTCQQHIPERQGPLHTLLLPVVAALIAHLPRHSHSQCSNAPARRCDTRKAAVVDAGAVAPLLRTFAMGIPELAGELAAVSGEADLAAPVPDEQRHLHGCALGSLCHPRRHVTHPQEVVALWQPQGIVLALTS